MYERAQSLGEEIANSVSHGAALVAAAVAAPFPIIAAARGGTAADIVGASVFAATMVLLYAASMLYHAVPHPRAKRLLRKLDHGAIYLLIAGTYTPLALLALPLASGVPLLIVVWAGALLGIGFRVFWIGAPRWLYVLLYIALGWAAMMYVVDLFNANAATMVLVVVGGLCYTAGAIIYGLKKPNPVPGVFGFHEIFHTLTVIAFLCHWTAILLIALNPPYNS